MKDSNQFNKFNGDLTHEQHPLGGYPIGGDDSVEGQETMSNKYIYSNRIPITKEAAAKYNLPKSAVGKTYAQFTDALNNHFKGRNGVPEQNTLKAGLDRAKAAQEEERAAMQQQIQQSQAINSTEVPDQMQGQVPQGMEGYVEPHFAGGDLSGVSGLAGLAGGFIPTDTMGGSVASGALSGAAAGAILGPLGMAGSALIGGIGSAFMKNKADKAALNAANANAMNANAAFSDKQYEMGGYLTNQFAQGGGLTGADRGSSKKPYPSVDSSDFAGGGRSYPIPTEADAIDALRLAGLHDRDDVRSKVYAKYPELKHAMGGSIVKDPFNYANGGDIDPRKTGDIRQVQEQPINSRIKDIMLNPLTAMGYKARGQDIPENLGRGLASGAVKRNVLDNVVDMINPAFYARSIDRGVNKALEGDLKGTLGEALNFVPVIKGAGVGVGYTGKLAKNASALAKMVNAPSLIDSSLQHLTGKGIFALGGDIDDPTNPLYKSTTTLPQVGSTLYPGVAKPEAPFVPYNTSNNVLSSITPAGMTNSFQTGQLKPMADLRTDGLIHTSNVGSTNPKLGLSDKQLGRAATLGAMLAPAIGNIFQKTGNAEVENPYINTRRFHYTPTDEAQLQNVAKNEMSNTIEAMKESGASPAQMRAAILGSSLNRTKGVSDALMAARARNQELDTMGQQFDQGIDEANIQRRMLTDDMNARNRAAAAREKSEKLAAITGNIADIGKFASGAEKVKNMTGYTQYGDYVLNPATNTWFTLDGQPASVQDVIKTLTPEQLAQYMSSKKPSAYGGYLFNNKRK